MTIVLVYRHNRRALATLWRDALRAATEGAVAVVTVGPWDAGEPYGTLGNEPDFNLPPRALPWYEWEDVRAVLPAACREPTCTIVIEQGDDLRVLKIPGPWAHHSVEGAHMAWSAGLTPSRSVAIRRPDHDPMRWYPNAVALDGRQRLLFAQRDYDFVHLATTRSARVAVWQHLRACSDFRLFMGEVWGPLYWDGYARAATTYVCSGASDFVTFRVFEAMAMGCLVFADEPPAMRELFEPNVHYVPYVPVLYPGDNEPTPDPQWLADAIRTYRDHPERDQMARAARGLVLNQHTMLHRARTILADIRKDWNIRWPL